jgi:2-polyprenyl-3-methyl-5-hydroxy-6-metoxy-1,4-benzoquinol methylase
MAAETLSSQPNPSRLFAALSGYQVTLAIRSAVELDVFTHIADGANTVKDIARRADASEKGIRILCDFLTIHGFLTKQGATYGLVSDAELFLNRRSPAYIGSIALFLAHPSQIKNYLDLTASVRKGGTAHDGNLAPENPLWVDFARYMAPMSAVGASALARVVATPGAPQKVLDIAAGSGEYGIGIAKLNPKAEIYAQDWKNVLDVSLEGARAAGVADRYHTLPGSAFDVDLGTGYDLVLLPNFLHHFDHPTNVTLLKRVRAALKPGGRVATVEFVPNEDRVTPPLQASFSMMMLGSTAGGDAYTFNELAAMFRDAGFSRSTQQELPPSPQILILTEY